MNTLICLTTCRPKDLKFPRAILIPKKGTVYDHIYTYRRYGSWNPWTSLVRPVSIEEKVQVSLDIFILSPLRRKCKQVQTCMFYQCQEKDAGKVGPVYPVSTEKNVKMNILSALKKKNCANFENIHPESFEDKVQKSLSLFILKKTF